jgi:hypothetical protein
MFLSLSIYFYIKILQIKVRSRDIYIYHMVNVMREVSQVSRMSLSAACFITNFKILNDQKFKVRGSFGLFFSNISKQ